MPPAVINLSNLDGTNGFTLDGEAPGHLSGGFVSGAGDVNGDGYDDLLVGAQWGDNPNGYNAGRTYVVFGSPDGFPAHLSLGALDGTNGFKFYGEQPFDNLGCSVSGAGDVNGDGIDDLIVGALEADPYGSSSGRSYVVFGSRKGFPALLSLAALDGGNGFALDGEAAGDKSGVATSAAGDVNGDGIDDLIVGSLEADPRGAQSGRSYVVFGTKAGFPARLSLSALDGANGFKLDGEAAGDASGYDASGAGDVNGDGIDDLIVGAFRADANGADSGRSYVVFGSKTGFPSRLPLSALNGTNGFKIDGEAEGGQSGQHVFGAGDVNGDGIGDLFVAAVAADFSGRDSGRSYVVFGSRAGFPARLPLASLDGTNGFKIDGEGAGDLSGVYACGPAGDFNADGFDDIILAARGVDANGVDSGRAYIVYGAASGFPALLSLASLDGRNGFKLNGERAGDMLGSSSGAGDVNGDGYDDVIIGATRGGPDGNGAGRSYVVYGFGSDAPSGETVTLRLGGDGGAASRPAFRVYADGALIGTGVIAAPQTAAERRAGGFVWSDFTFDVDAAPGSVSVEFVNDGRDPLTDENLNLFVRSATFGGETYMASEHGVYRPADRDAVTNGTAGKMWWNGTLEIAPPQIVEVTIGGTGGRAHRPAFTVWADGVRIGEGVVENPQTNAERCAEGVDWENFAFETRGTPETVEVRFENDGRDPLSDEDLNLFVDKVAFGGRVWESEIDGWFTPDEPAPGREGPREELWWSGTLAFGERDDTPTLDGLILWNKLGSPEEVANSEIGPGFGLRPGVLFVDGVYESGFATTGGETGGGAYLTMAPGDFFGEDISQGTVEMWLQKRIPDLIPYESPLVGIFGDQPYNRTTPRFQALGAGWSDGFTGNDGLQFGITDKAGRIHLANDLGWDKLNVGEWFHLALVWDIDGINGARDRMRIYRDGGLVASNTDEIEAVMEDPDDVHLLGHHAYSRFGQPTVYMDNIKVWDQARTDFSDRFIEGYDDPAGLVAGRPEDAGWLL